MSFFKNSKNNWIRWILLIPITVFSYVLAPVVIKVIYDIISLTENLSPFYNKYIVTSISGFTSGYLLVYVAAKFAPKWKFAISFSFFIIAFIIIILTSLSGYTVNVQYSALTENITTLIGSGYALYKQYKDVEQKI